MDIAGPRPAWPLPWNESLDKGGRHGRGHPGGRFELIGVDGEIITEPHVTGELRYYGENMTLGYAQCGADLAKGDERGGVLDTGDMAQVDEDGCYTVVGRKKRFLKMYGNRVNLDETERMLRRRSRTQECACAGPGRPPDDLLPPTRTRCPPCAPWLSEKTGLNQSGFHTMHLDAIPKNDAGKTLYRELEKYHV